MNLVGDPATPLAAFVAGCGEPIRGDETGAAQRRLDHRFRAFGNAGLKEAGAIRAAPRPGPPPNDPDPAWLLSTGCLGTVGR